MVSSTARTQQDEYHSVSVRKIDNGFIVNKSTSGPKGYKSSETYHVKKPNIDIQSTPDMNMSCKAGRVNLAALRKASGNKKVKST